MLTPEKQKQYDAEIFEMCERIQKKKKDRWKWLLLGGILCPLFLPVAVGLVVAGMASNTNREG
jgi:cytochrome bd-type quinol oxidase subunit 2